MDEHEHLVAGSNEAMGGRVMPNYTDTDLEAFRGLAAFGGKDSTQDEAQETGLGTRVAYARSDIDQFARLMAFAGPPNPAQTATDKTLETSAGASIHEQPAYRPADLAHFERIMASVRSDLFEADTVGPASGPVSENATTPPYSSEDLQAFAGLMQFGSVMPPHEMERREPERSSGHRYVAPPADTPAPSRIKIVDADKERVRERQAQASGQKAIKIVFSDAGYRRP